MRLLKSVLTLFFLCLAAFFISAALRLGFTRAGGPPQDSAPSRNGDVNCDGDLDVSDAITILDWLFRGGEAPCAFAENPPADVGVLVSELRGLREAVDFCCRNPGPPSDQVVNGTVRVDRLAPGAVFDLLRVPADKWFVMTDSFFNSNSSVFQFVEITEAGQRPVFPAALPFSSTIGLRFAPGSTIALLNTAPTATFGPFPVSFLGYFADR